MNPTSLLPIVQAVGVPVAICLLVLWGAWLWLNKLDAKLDRKDETHAAERKAANEEHLAAWRAEADAARAERAQLVLGLDRNTDSLNKLGESVRDLNRDLRPSPRVVNG